MSEDSKMGLFGSKDDKNESTSTDANKPNSADRYTPYCIDSDSETYDTEALSIMDINDIIGVQTGSAVESTLESEIAALSEIITDSKGETTCDTMNELPEENSKIKFNQQLLGELSSLGTSANPVASTSQESLEQDLITHQSMADDADENIKDETTSKEIQGTSGTDLLDIKNNSNIGDEATAEAKDIPSQESGQNTEDVNPESTNMSKEEPSLSSNVGDPDHVVKDSSAAKNIPPTETLNVTEIQIFETKTTTADNSQATTQSTAEAVEENVTFSLDNEMVEDNIDSSKCKNVAIVSVLNTETVDSDLVEAVDSTVKRDTVDKELDSNPSDEKLEDVLTNVGSTSKSLQLIGEAYISEDSQEIDETDECPVVRVDTFLQHNVEESKTKEENNDSEKEKNSDDPATYTVTNKLNVIVTADNSESTVANCDLDNQDSAPLGNNMEPDNKKEVSPNLQDNVEECVESPVIVQEKGDHVIDTYKPDPLNLEDEKTASKSNKPVEITLATSLNIERDSSTTQKTMSMLPLEQEGDRMRSELSEGIPENVCIETVTMTLKENVLKSEMVPSLEKLREEISEQTSSVDKIMESSNTIALEGDNVSKMDLKVSPLAELECSFDVDSADLKTDSDNETEEVNPEIQVKRMAEKPSENIGDKDCSTILESNIKTKITDPENSRASPFTVRLPIIKDDVSAKNAESSELPTEISTNSKDVDNTCIPLTSPEISISAEKQSNKISDDVEKVTETMAEAEKGRIVNVGQEDISHLAGDRETDEKGHNDEHRNITINIAEMAEKIHSEPRDLGLDETSKSESMTSISVTVEETVRESSSCIEMEGVDVEKTKNLKIDLNQSAGTVEMEENAPVTQIIETENPEQTESSNEVEQSMSDVLKADSLPSEILEKRLDEEKNNTTDIHTEEQIQTESHTVSTTDAVESEPSSSIRPEDLLDSTSADVISKNVEFAESHLSKDNLNDQEMIKESLKLETVHEAGSLVDETPVKSEIFETKNQDKQENVETEAYDEIKQFLETESITELSVDGNEKQADDVSDTQKMEISVDESLTETSSEILCAKAATYVEGTLEAITMQDLVEDKSYDESQAPPATNEKEELKIQPVERQGNNVDTEISPELDAQLQSTSQENEMKCEELSSSNDGILSSTSHTLSEVSVESRKQDCAEIELEKLAVKKQSPAFLDKANVNLPESASDKTCDVETDKKRFNEIECESVVFTGISASSEVKEKLGQEKLLAAESVDDKLPIDIDNSQTMNKNSERKEVPTGKIEVDINPEETISILDTSMLPTTLASDLLVDTEVKMEENLQSQCTEETQNLTAEETEVIIQKLADAASVEAATSLESIEKILPNMDLSVTTIPISKESESETAIHELPEIEEETTSHFGDINEKFDNQDLNEALPSVSHDDTNYVTNIMISSTNIDDDTQFTDNKIDMHADEFAQKIEQGILETSDNLIPEETLAVDRSPIEIEDKLVIDKNLEIILPLKQDEESMIEHAVFQACDDKIDLSNEELFDAGIADQADVLCDTAADNASQQSSEFSELECAVKFLQESEEQTIDSPLLLSPKITDEIVEDNSEQSKSCLFLSETEVCQDGSLELPVELEDITPDSIAISEAEIISEAAKLENERKLKIAEEMSKSSDSIEQLDAIQETSSGNNSEMLKTLLTTAPKVSNMPEKTEENVASTSEKSENIELQKLTGSIIRRSEKIPKISILEERLKEPPKIEIPIPEGSPKISDTPMTPKTSLLIQKDSRIDTKLLHQKMLESPKGADKSEPKIVDTPRKDSEKYDFENVGSPRIILKIAKSAIADCGEPRSPKSPKIRSAANSPNPDDSPGQKLGKIKLKLSRGGHPSIISNENVDESAQRHTEAILSPSHIGMKIKLSKTGDASIIQPEKHDSVDEIKESKHKFDDHSPKRIESPLGMKIKLSKTGDPSIVQQESKESTSKRKDKLDIGQEIPKRTDSPIGMKIKLSKSGDASIIQPEKQESTEGAVYNDKFEHGKDIPKRTESPIGMKIKLSKTGDASIISTEGCEEFKDSPSKCREKLNVNQDIPKRTDSPLGMKFKLTKSGGASIIQPDKPETFEDYKDKSENTVEIIKRVESPIGMKIKLLKTGDASIIHPDKQESDEQKRTDSPIGMRIKVTKTGEASVVQSEELKDSLLINTENFDITHEMPKRNESPIGMKIKLSKSGDASIIHPDRQEVFDDSKDSSGSNRASSNISQEGLKSAESSLGMKIKLSRTGDASIIHPETPPEFKRTDSPFGMKIKLSKTGDASIIEPDKKDKSSTKQKEKLSNAQEVSQKRKDMEFPLEMKIKLSKTGHPTIIANEKQESLSELHSKSKDHFESGESTHHKHAESTSTAKDSQLRIFKTGHSTIIQSNRSEVTIEPIQMGASKPESAIDISPKSKEVVISPIEPKRTKLESKLSHILPEVTIQSVKSGEQQQQIMLDNKSSSISRQQMSVINQEISITQVPLSKPPDLSMSGKLKEILRKNATNSPASSDCEIIEHRPELIIVNENSNSSQDIMIIEEVKAPPLEVKVPRKRGRPKRSTLPPGPPLARQGYLQDPLALANLQPSTAAETRESDRPKRTCRNQKSYAPPKRGRGRGRGRRKMDREDCAIGKIPRLEDPLTAIERSTLSLIAPLQPRMMAEPTAQTSELYKALKQSPTERKRMISETMVQHSFPDAHKKMRLESEPGKQLIPDLLTAPKPDEQLSIVKTGLDTSDPKAAMISDMLHLSDPVNAQQNSEKLIETPKPEIQESKNIISALTTTEHQNWLTPSIKLPETSSKTEAISMVQVMDEETRMSAESNSRSQTPARNITIPAVETAINEESQGSVLSTATTESEKVKVRNRRMEINFDPDEGPFTVDKIAEYEWPLDRKGDTFMIQEQISQYLGVKSFKRKYPDLKRRMVEMEERNFLRENGLVSEAMCDMGLTAICSTEVLDIMCSDFPDQYEEYRKHMREKQAKEHSKKQKELTAAANAERNRIDLAEMAVQSALSWNVNFNKARKESRKYSLDLQSFTIHVPKKQQKVDAERKASNYPVALIPGQYTDYYREYTPAELRYYPLNTVLYGPMRPNERKFDSQSEGSQSDSDSDSSSDDSSSTSSEGTQDTEESQSTVDDVDMEVAANKEDNKNLKCKMCLRHLNKHGKAEVLIQCGTCNGNVHPSCIDLTLDMVPHIQGYSWQCTDCKTCVQCHNPADEDKMLFCDMCDRGYHIYCVGLRRVPQGRWHCRECAVCASCGLRQPGGANSDRNSVAQWQHEYKKGERNTRVYVSTLCVPCSKLWRKGRYCPHCSRCHSAQRLDLEPNLVHCGACDKYLHLGCVEIRSGTLDRKNYICECCSTPNHQLPRSLISKTYKT